MSKPKKDVADDERFAEIAWHPKYRRMPRQVRKVKIDKRFQSMFVDPNFKTKHTVDKRGRPIARTSNEDLRRFYDLNSDEDDEEEAEENEGKIEGNGPEKNTEVLRGKNEKNKGEKEDGDSDDDEDEHSEKSEENEEQIRLDLARGEGNLSSSSSDESGSEWEFEEGPDSAMNNWADLEEETPSIQQPTHRLAVCHMDWDRLKARDLLILFNSFKPASGIIRSVRVYPSEYGKQRMAEEERYGPPKDLPGDEDVSKKNVSEESDEDDGPLEQKDEDRRQRILREKLRRYQIQRLRYYYAVIECDSAETADHIYTNCDGTEYETSGAKLDLRYIPDDMSFEDDTPRDEATSLSDLTSYRPTVFVCTALQQSRPTLTWEEEHDPDRAEITKKAFDNPTDWDRLELNKILASPSTSENEQSDEEPANFEEEKMPKKRKITKYEKHLLDGDGGGKNKDGDDMEMEIKWDADEEKDEEKDHEKSTDRKMGKNDSTVTPWQKYLERRKDKRRQRKDETRQRRQSVKRRREGLNSDDDTPEDFKKEIRKLRIEKKKKKAKITPPDEEEDGEEKAKKTAELELLLADSDEDKKKRNFNLKKILKAEKSKSKFLRKTGEKPAEKDEKNGDNFEINVQDPRFQAVFTSHLYNIDPSDPNFKKTPGMRKVVEEKLKSASIRQDHEKTEAKIPETKINDLSLLAKKVKSKTDVYIREKKDRRK